MKYTVVTVIMGRATENNSGTRRGSREQIYCPGELWF